MTSRQAQKLFFALSVDSLPPEVAVQVKEHIDGCTDCQHEWVLVERTLLMLSTTSQPVISSEKSIAMWLSCQQQLKGDTPHIAKRRVLKIGTPQTKSSQTASARASQPRSEARRPDFFNWLSRPAWGWTALGVAGTVFAAAWLLPATPPATQSFTAVTPIVPGSDTASSDATASDWLDLSPLPGEHAPLRAANSMIEHHAALDVAPFDDPVSATLVSYHSAQPAP